jgi:hypothetical protein
MGGHAADARTTTRANRGLSRCRGPSARTCKEMPGVSGELNAGLKKIGTIMNLSSDAGTHKSESPIPQRSSRGHQSPARHYCRNLKCRSKLPAPGFLGCREHSRKPDKVRKRIEPLVDGPSSLFVRETKAGWHCYGHQTGPFYKGAASTRRLAWVIYFADGRHQPAVNLRTRGMCFQGGRPCGHAPTRLQAIAAGPRG